MQTTIHSRIFGEFLKSRRERILPEAVGIKSTRRRRTPGLRREEVAYLGHISLSYYTWLEQGKDVQPSREILSNLSRALKLSSEEEEHLFNLAYKDEAYLPTDNLHNTSLQAAVDELPFPSFITDPRSKLVVWNEKAEKQLFPFSAFDEQHLLRLLFLEERYRERIQNIEEFSAFAVSAWRKTYERYPEDPMLNQLLATLKEQSEAFGKLWKEHDVKDTVKYLSFKNEDQIQRYRIHSSSRVDGDAHLCWCMYMPVS